MARTHPTYSLKLLFTLLTAQMLSTEGREIKTPNRVGIKDIKNHSLISIRKLGSVITQSDSSESSTGKNTPQKTNTDFPQTMTHDNNVPLEPTKISHIVDSPCVQKVDRADDHHPVAPGHSDIHSPGQSFLPITEKMSPNQTPKSPKLWKRLALSADDYRHTTPGHSPGAGHSKENSNKPSLRASEEKKYFPSKSPTSSSVLGASLVASENDFRHTAPGLSPGAGHSDVNKNDKEESRHCLNEKCTEDFRPTALGDSPGAGHSSVNDSESNTSKQAKHLGTAHTNAGETDDYRPTAPGHSPGAGHPILEETRKPILKSLKRLL